MYIYIYRCTYIYVYIYKYIESNKCLIFDIYIDIDIQSLYKIYIYIIYI